MQVPELLTVKEIAAMTKTSPRSWYNWLSAGKCPFTVIRINGAVRFKASEINEYIENGGR